MATEKNPSCYDLDLTKAEASFGGDSTRETAAPAAPICGDSEKSQSKAAAKTLAEKNQPIGFRENNNYKEDNVFDDYDDYFPEENDKEEDTDLEDDLMTQMWEENCRAMDDELQRQIDEQMDQALQDQLDRQLTDYFYEQDQRNDDELINDAFPVTDLDEGLFPDSWDNHGVSQQEVDVNSLILRLSQTTVTSGVKQQPTFEAISAEIQKVVDRHAQLLATEEKD